MSNPLKIISRKILSVSAQRWTTPIISFEKKKIAGRQNIHTKISTKEIYLLLARFNWKLTCYWLAQSDVSIIKIYCFSVLDRYLEMPLSCRSVEPNQIVLAICTQFCELIIDFFLTGKKVSDNLFSSLILKHAMIYLSNFLGN